MFESVGQFILWMFLLGCVLPIIILTILGILAFWFGKRWLQDFMEPDVTNIHATFDQLQQQNPNATREQLIRRIINQQAFRCGLVGAVTGIGGFVTLPFALPIDMIVSAKIISNMTSYIAQAYGYKDSLENKAATYAIMTSSGDLSALSARLLQRYLPRLLGKTFSKLVPFIGAIAGFGLNYMFAQSTARLAIQWYSRKPKQEVIAIGNQEKALASAT